MKHWLTSVILFIALGAQAQIGIPFQNAIWRGSDPMVEGSPYLEDTWKLGTVRDTENDREYRVFLKYDTHIDRVVISSYGRPAVLDEVRYPEFTIGDSSHQFSSDERIFRNASQFSHPGLNGYYEVLHEGSYLLLRKVSTDFIPNTIPEYGTNRKVILYLTREDLYLVDPEGTLNKVPSRDRQIMGLFDDREDRVQLLVARENLDLENTRDLIRLLELAEE